MGWMGGQADTGDPQLRCMICDALNTMDVVLCSECFAPMALVHDSVTQGRAPQIISVLGDSNVGKTVYLGFLLDMLSQRANEFEAIPKGAYSVDLQQNVVSSMTQRAFPQKTAMEPDRWSWAYYQARKSGGRRSKWYDLVMPDLAGESLAAEIANPATYRVIRSLLTKSTGAMLLVDAALAANGATRPDFFALKMMSYIDSLFQTKRDAKVTTPIAIVLCKADHCPESFDDTRRFVQGSLNRLWNLCESRFSTVEYFACSAVGSLAYATGADDDGLDFARPIPLHTSLQGILEPFEWLISKM
jgi:hypothetical protein